MSRQQAIEKLADRSRLMRNRTNEEVARRQAEIQVRPHEHSFQPHSQRRLLRAEDIVDRSRRDGLR